MPNRSPNADIPPGKHDVRTERQLDAIEYSARIRTLEQLQKAVARLIPQDVRRRPAGRAVYCEDRERRIQILQARVRLGLELWHPGDVLHLPDARAGHKSPRMTG